MGVARSLRICLALFFLASAPVFAQTPPPAPATQEEVKKLQDQIGTLEKDLAVLKAESALRHDGFEKRLTDRLEPQNARISDLGISISHLGGLIAKFSVGITVFAIIAGLLGLISVDARVKSEAQKVAEAWYDRNAQRLKEEFDRLHDENTKLKISLEEFHQKKSEGEASIESDVKEIQALKNQVMQEKSGIGDSIFSESRENKIETASFDAIKILSENLKLKPEIYFNAKDFFVKSVYYLYEKNYHLSLMYSQRGVDIVHQELDADFIEAQLFGVKIQSHYELQEFEKAIETTNELVQKFRDHQNSELRRRIAICLNNKGFMLGKLGRSEDEINVYDEIDRCYGQDKAPALREQVARALFNKGSRLGRLDYSEDAIQVYEEIDRRYRQDTAFAVQEQVAIALFNKGVRLGKLDRSAEEIQVYDEVDRRYGRASTPTFSWPVVKALVNKGFRLGKLGHSEDAIKVYEEIDRRYGQDTTPAVQEQVAIALNNKGVELSTLGRSEDEIKVYEEIDLRFGRDPSPALRQQVVKALLYEANTLGVLNRSQDQIQVYEEIDRRYGQDAAPAVREHVAKALINRGITLGLLDRSGEAIQVFDLLISRYGADGEPEMKKLVADAVDLRKKLTDES